ncbi:Coatomer subunit beta, partial [Fragariocoptes setiger]
MAAPYCWTLLNAPNGESISDLKKGLESDNVETKLQAMQNLVQALMNGEKFPPNIIMTIIRHVLPNEDKRIKKLLLLFWDIVPKRQEGRLMQEMILVCDAYRKDLEHPNEYICGATLRFLAHLEEPELLGELISAIFSCLSRNQPYTRRNAVVAIAKIYANFKSLIPDAPERISEYLEQEKDDDCKRAALLALMHVDYLLGQKYMDSCVETIYRNSHSMQILFVDLIGKICTTNRDVDEIKKYIEILYSLISASSSRSVRYQAAATLMKLTRSAQAIKVSANCFIDICTKESDNNVKLIALDSLIDLRKTRGAERVLQGTMMDFLRILQSASDLEVRQKVLKLSLELATSSNVREMAFLLRKEVIRLFSTNVLGTVEETTRYRLLLVDTLHQICMKFPEALIDSRLTDTLFEMLTSEAADEKTAAKINSFVKIFMVKHPEHQATILTKILNIFNMIPPTAPIVHQNLIWLLGEFSTTCNQIEDAYEVIKDSLGSMPLLQTQLEATRSQESGDQPDLQSTSHNARQVTADGSYVTQSAASISVNGTSVVSSMPPLRAYFMSNRFITSELADALVKMAIRYQKDCRVVEEVNLFLAKCQLILSSILNLHRSPLVDADGLQLHINSDRYEKLFASLKMLMFIPDANEDASKAAILRDINSEFKREALRDMIESSEQENLEVAMNKKPGFEKISHDDRVNISMLEPKQDEIITELEEGTSKQSVNVSEPTFRPKISEVIPLTGHTDPVYAECKFSVNQYDIGLDVLLKNQTEDTLQNVMLELHTHGDLTLVNAKNDTIVLGPLDFTEVHASVKVLSTENGRIFGNIVYDVSGTSERENMVVTNSISVNITDYIKPAVCSDEEFRDMWREFEWENKVNVGTQLTNLKEYLEHLVASTNMNCVSPPRALSGHGSTILCANLYAKSYFGEDALVNVSIEQESPRSVVTGHVKVRSRSQGMALGLGEKISSVQGGVKAA